MQIFVGHDFKYPPLRRYRRPFEKLAAKYNIDFKFADELHRADHLLDQIEELIERSDYSLFDVSTWNRNVFLELGFARGRRRPNALLFRPASGLLWQLGFSREGYADVPSDIKGLRQIRYSSERSLGLQLDDLVRELMPNADLSRTQNLLTMRVEEHIGRHARGLSVREISSHFNIDKELASASVRNLLNLGRIERVGTRYRKTANSGRTVATG